MEKAGVVLGVLISAGFCSASAVSKDTMDVPLERAAKVAARERLEADRAELKRLRLVDSVGWEKVKAIRRPDEPLAQLEKEQLQRKMNALIGFCNEARFAKAAEVDSLKDMTPEEKGFCKERLKILNPTLP